MDAAIALHDASAPTLEQRLEETQKGLLTALARIEHLKTLTALMAQKLGVDWDQLLSRTKRRLEARDRAETKGKVCPATDNGLRCVQWAEHPGDHLYG